MFCSLLIINELCVCLVFLVDFKMTIYELKHLYDLLADNILETLEIAVLCSSAMWCTPHSFFLYKINKTTNIEKMQRRLVIIFEIGDAILYTYDIILM